MSGESKALVIALPGATKGVLEELSERNGFDVFIESVGEGLFQITGELETVQALIAEARPLTSGIALAYQDINSARASLMPT